MIGSGGGGAEQQQHGGAEEGERGSAGAISSEIPADPRSAERKEGAAGHSDTQVDQYCDQSGLLINLQQNQQLITISDLYVSPCSENRCVELREESANHRAELSRQLKRLRAELESEGGALRGRLEEAEREKQGEPANKHVKQLLHRSCCDHGNQHVICVSELRQAALAKDTLVEETYRQTEALRQGIFITY